MELLTLHLCCHYFEFLFSLPLVLALGKSKCTTSSIRFLCINVFQMEQGESALVKYFGVIYNAALKVLIHLTLC